MNKWKNVFKKMFLKKEVEKRKTAIIIYQKKFWREFNLALGKIGIFGGNLIWRLMNFFKFSENLIWR